MTTCSVNLGKIRIGTTKRLRATILKDGVPWAGIDTVTITFLKPDRETEVGPRSMTVENDTLGIWYYDTTTTELNTLGYWTAHLEIIDGVVVEKYDEDIGFRVIQ